MLPRSPFARRLWSASAVILAAAASVAVLRGTAKTYAPSAPDYRAKGPAQAAVTVVEFSDFQCPACRYAVEPLKKMEALYGQDLRVIFKHFPLLRTHPRAKPAAVAAECAGRQGRFWEMHDRLYATQAEWSKDETGKVIAGYAKDLGLDPAAFSACLQDPSVASAIDQDMQEANNRWVMSTPTFFINGRRFIGARQLQDRGVIWVDKILRNKK